MPSQKPHPSSASHFRSLDVLRRQHTEIHSVVHALEHGGSTVQVKRSIAAIIAALAMVQSQID